MENSILDIVVVNWNSGSLLSECLEFINKSKLDNYRVHVYVVDNNSKDNSFECCNDIENVTLIRNTNNRGFGVACNQAIELGDSRYVLLLNPDTRIGEDVLLESIKFMESNNSISVMGCRMVDENGKTHITCARFPKLSTVIYDTVGVSKLFPSIFHQSTHMKDWPHNSSRYVDHVMGAYMFIRRDILNKIGYFDECYFMYMEDLDLSKRVNENDGKVYYNVDITIYHESGGTSKQIKATRLFYATDAKLIYYQKYFPPMKYRISRFFVLNIEPQVRKLFLFLKGDKEGIKEVNEAFKLLYSKYNQLNK